MRIVAITGGIGSGKSTVSRVLRTLGYAVYDCDSQARQLMDGSLQIKRKLREAFGTDVVRADGTINRPALAKVVFADAGALATLNAIVHPRVRGHFVAWAASHPTTGKTLFVETAILEESGLGHIVHEVWRVYAPEALRVDRVVRRSGMTPAEVRARMASQSHYSQPLPDDLINDGHTAILPQIMRRL